MRLIDADKLYKYLDDVEYPCDKYAEVEDILDIIKEQTEVKAIIVPNIVADIQEISETELKKDKTDRGGGKLGSSGK